ncbi:hypothetical protein HPB48_004280 [Haemaphysalis longicornis]|uniref:Uncharacterized protein n=1 Tax=Haemaphysalis longicornis TaxID=44386 RepID=A0A9J6GJA1_HAELO|nr:hypothetical protein HPB48_004280 [Haemaphysalis longicornis]
MAPTTRGDTGQKESLQGSGGDAAADAVLREAAEHLQPRQMTAMFAEITRMFGSASLATAAAPVELPPRSGESLEPGCAWSGASVPSTHQTETMAVRQEKTADNSATLRALDPYSYEERRRSELDDRRSAPRQNAGFRGQEGAPFCLLAWLVYLVHTGRDFLPKEGIVLDMGRNGYQYGPLTQFFFFREHADARFTIAAGNQFSTVPRRARGTAVAKRIMVGGVPIPSRVQAPASAVGDLPPTRATRPTKGGSGRRVRLAKSDPMDGGPVRGVRDTAAGPASSTPTQRRSFGRGHLDGGLGRRGSVLLGVVVLEGPGPASARGLPERVPPPFRGLTLGGAGRRAAASVLRGGAEGAVRHLRHPRRQLGRPQDRRPAPGADSESEEREGGSGRSWRRGQHSSVGAVRTYRRARGAGRAGIDGNPTGPAQGRARGLVSGKPLEWRPTRSWRVAGPRSSPLQLGRLAAVATPYFTSAPRRIKIPSENSACNPTEPHHPTSTISGTFTVSVVLHPALSGF